MRRNASTRKAGRAVVHDARALVPLELDSYRQEHAMMDVIVLALAVVFFVATIAYAYACDRL
jgi:hypothetical protein